jgi:hypothetical protein
MSQLDLVIIALIVGLQSGKDASDLAYQRKAVRLPNNKYSVRVNHENQTYRVIDSERIDRDVVHTKTTRKSW